MNSDQFDIKLSLFRYPRLTIKFFVRSIIRSLCYIIGYWFYLIILSICGYLIYILPELEIVKNHLYFSLYWLGLGVVSSIGLGTGLHTGLLYLFPHVIKIARENGSDQIWLSISQLYYPTVLWGIGTALGEIPPYYMARMYKLNKKKKDNNSNNSNNYVSATAEHDVTNDINKLVGDNSVGANMGMKTMIEYMQKYGFWMILLSASYPNALFDMCGMAAGYCMIPFGSFIIATIIGKAFIKATYQMILFILGCFPEMYLKFLPEFLYTVIIDMIDKVDGIIKNSNDSNDSNDSINTGSMYDYMTFSNIWSCIVSLFVLFFVIGTIDAIAQNEYERDDEVFQEREDASVKKNN